MSDVFRRFDEIDALLERALELPEGEREAFVTRASGDDEELREAALRLLDDTRAGSPPIEPGAAVAALGARAAELAREEAAERPAALAAGDRFGPYEVLAPLGAGGMGEVYRARDTRLGREVALKVLPREVAEDPERLARLEREARLLARLDHPRINTIHELEETVEGKALVLELVEGPTLAERLEEGPLDPAEALRAAGEIASALEAAHQAGVLHRDLKPANVKLTPSGEIKVLDFGLAKPVARTSGEGRAEASLGLTERIRPGAVLGTAAYMSPELVRGGAPGRASDLWAFGCLLFELLTGARAFAGETGLDTAAAVLEREPDWSALPAATPRRVRKLLRACLQKDPAERLADAATARREIENTRTVLGSKTTRRLVVGAVLAGLLTLGVPLLRNLPQRSPPPAGAIDSVAVLPFENLGEDPDDAYLSDGLTESLINSLSRLPNLRVVPRGIVFGYRGRQVDPAKVADELGVRALVTGRVGERGDTLTIAAELIDPAGPDQIWGRQYQQPRGDLIAVRDELVSLILDELRLELTPEERQEALDPATENPEAYRLYLRATYHLARLTPDGLDEGLAYARRAVELDPGFALAWVALSYAHMSRGFVGLDPWSEALEGSRAAARRALALDDRSAEAWTELGFVRHHADWDWEGARAAFARALELDPDSPEALQGHSDALLSLGRVDEAVAAAQRAVAAAPFSANYHHWLAFCYRAARRWDESMAAARKTLELEPGHYFAKRSVDQILHATGRSGEALDNYRKELAEAGVDPGTDVGWAWHLAMAGRRDEARRILDAVDAGPRGAGELDAFELQTLAWTLGAVGENDRAFEVIDQMLEERSPGLLWAHLSPGWDQLRADPRFAELLRRMNLPQR